MRTTKFLAFIFFCTITTLAIAGFLFKKWTLEIGKKPIVQTPFNARLPQESSDTQKYADTDTAIDSNYFPIGAKFGEKQILTLDGDGNLNTEGNVSVGNIYIGQSAYVSSLNLSNSLYVSGNEIIDNSGRIPGLTVDYLASLDGSALSGVNAGKLGGYDADDFIKSGIEIDADKVDGVSAGSFLRSDESDVAGGAITFTALPGSTSASGGGVYINPVSANSNYALFGIALDGTQKFIVDAEGDITVAGNLTVNGSISGSGSSPWTDSGSYLYPTNGEILGNSTSGGTNKIEGLYLEDNAPLYFGNDNDTNISFSGSALSFLTGSNDINFSSDSFFLDVSSNYLGIGTALPSESIHIVQETGGTLLIQSTKNDSSWNAGVDGVGAIEFYSNDTSGGGAGVKAAIREISPTTDGRYGQLSFFTADGSTNDVERLRINSTGGVNTLGNLAVGSLTTVQSNKLFLYNSSSTLNNVSDIGLSTAGGGGTAVIGAIANSVSGGSRKTSLYFTTVDQSTGGAAERMRLDHAGNLGIGIAIPLAKLDVEGNVQINLSGTQTSTALCGSHSAGGSATESDVEIVDCTGTPAADYMEMYPVEESADKGTVVAIGSSNVTTKDGDTIKQLVRSTKAYQNSVIGIVSDKSKAGDFNSIGYNIEDKDNPQPIALAGRVPVKVANTSEEILAGDFITSSNEIGKAMKATKAGQVIGKALEDWSPNSGKSTVMVFVQNSYYLGGDITLDSTSGSFLSLNSTQDMTSEGLLSDNSTQTIITELETMQGLSFDTESDTLTATSIFKTIEEFISEGIATFKNTVKFLADVTFGSKVNFQDEVTYSDKVVYEDKDIAGYAQIKSGLNEVRVTFEDEYVYPPIVQVTPQGNYNIKYWTTDVSVKGFTIKIDPRLAEDVKFSWSALSVKDAKTYQGTEEILVSPIPESIIINPSPTPIEESTSSATLDTPLSTQSAVILE